jgi:hypothetical protein
MLHPASTSASAVPTRFTAVEWSNPPWTTEIGRKRIVGTESWNGTRSEPSNLIIELPNTVLIALVQVERAAVEGAAFRLDA